MKKTKAGKARKTGNRSGAVKRMTTSLAGPASSRQRTVLQSARTGRITRCEARAAIEQYLKDFAAQPILAGLTLAVPKTGTIIPDMGRSAHDSGSRLNFTLTGAKVRDVRFHGSSMSVDLADGRTITVPVEWVSAPGESYAAGMAPLVARLNSLRSGPAGYPG